MNRFIIGFGLGLLVIPIINIYQAFKYIAAQDNAMHITILQGWAI